MALPEQHWGIDPYNAGWLLPGVVEFTLGILKQFNDGTGIFCKGQSGLGRCDDPCIPVKELMAQVGFQLLDGSGNNGCGQVFHSGGLGNIPVSQDMQE